MAKYYRQQVGQFRVKRVGQLAVKHPGQFALKQVGQFTVKWVGQFGVIFSTCRLENAWPVFTPERIAFLGLDESGTDKPGPEVPAFDEINPDESGWAESDPIYIIVLGAGHTPDPRLEPSQMLSQKVMMRLVEAIRVYRLLPGSRMVTSASAVHGEFSQAEALKQAAISLGVDKTHIFTQEDPTNTCEEARAFVRDHGTGSRVVIATSALHQRRAMMLFEKQGARPVAAPAAFAVKKNPDRPFRFKSILPSLKNVDKLENALWEYSGYFWDSYRCSVTDDN